MVVNYVYVVLKKLVHGKRTLLKSEGKVYLCRKGSKYAFKIVALLSSTSLSPPSHLQLFFKKFWLKSFVLVKEQRQKKDVHILSRDNDRIQTC